MKHKLMQGAIWIVADPRRARFLTFVGMTALALVASTLPGGVGLAGWAPGSSD